MQNIGNFLPEVKWFSAVSCLLASDYLFYELQGHLEMGIAASLSGMKYKEGVTLLAFSALSPHLDSEEFIISVSRRRHIPYPQGLSGTQTVTCRLI